MENALGKHIHAEYDSALDELRQSFVRMFTLLQSMLSDTCNALESSDTSLAEETRKIDKKVDELDRHIGENIVIILAQWQPLAGDLRYILACSRSVAHLERIGDYIKNICKRIRSINQDSNSLPDSEIKNLLSMFAQAEAMLKLTAEAYNNQNIDNCSKIIRMDNILDNLHKDTFASLQDGLHHKDAEIPVYLSAMLISKSLERIGDHITNVAEMLMFSVKAVTYTRGQLINQEDT